MAVDLGYDESGSGDVLIVSAQGGVSEQVRGMNRLWKQRLRSLKYFHSKEFNNLSYGIFTDTGLDRSARKALLRDLSKLIRRHLLFSVTASVSLKEYETLTTPAFRSRMGTAYGFLIDMCMLLAHARCEIEFGYKSEFNMLVEQGHRNAEQVAQILAIVSKIPEELLPLPIKLLTTGLGKKEDHPVLQAADMAAYSHWQSWNNGDSTIWKALYKPGNRYRSWAVKCDKELIRTFVEGPEAPKQFVLQQKALMQSDALHGSELEIPEIQGSDGGHSESTTHGSSEEVGLGESGKGEKAEH